MDTPNTCAPTKEPVPPSVQVIPVPISCNLPQSPQSPCKAGSLTGVFPEPLPPLPPMVLSSLGDVLIKPEQFVLDQSKLFPAEVLPETPPKSVGLSAPTPDDIKRIGEVDTLDTARKIREILLRYSISQRAFGHRVLGKIYFQKNELI